MTVLGERSVASDRAVRDVLVTEREATGRAVNVELSSRRERLPGREDRLLDVRKDRTLLRGSLLHDATST